MSLSLLVHFLTVQPSTQATYRNKRDVVEQILSSFDERDLERILRVLNTGSKSSHNEHPQSSPKQQRELMNRTTAREDEEDPNTAVIRSLTRQVMMLQLNAEESSRAAGDSGIKQVSRWKVPEH